VEHGYEESLDRCLELIGSMSDEERQEYVSRMGSSMGLDEFRASTPRVAGALLDAR
jgi:hypothetical protein